MASDFVERIHEDLLKKLIENSGLRCIRSRQQSLESEMFEEIEENVVVEEQQTIAEIKEEEAEEFIPEEAAKEEEPAIFPSPSLRKVLPDKVRQIQLQNRIRVLPEEFKKNIDPAEIPKIDQTPHQKYIDILANMVGCKYYKSSLAEFWFLDTLANLLRRAQDDDLNRATQAVLILWFCEWMKEMQKFDAADRQRMLRRFEDNMLAAAKFAAEELHIPSPSDAGVFYKSIEETDARSTMTRSATSTRSAAPLIMAPTPNSLSAPVATSTDPTVAFEGTAFECAMRDLTKIIHYIFDLFSTDFQYDLVRSVFTFSPDYALIDSPYQLQIPKRLYTPLKTKAKKEKSPKKEKAKDAKGKKKEPDTAEYLALMELKAKDEREVEEQEEKDREEYNQRSNILPLVFAATQELFDKYWPPPPPPEPEPEATPEPPAKGKGKKGKK